MSRWNGLLLGIGGALMLPIVIQSCSGWYLVASLATTVLVIVVGFGLHFWSYKLTDDPPNPESES